MSTARRRRGPIATLAVTAALVVGGSAALAAQPATAATPQAATADLPTTRDYLRSATGDAQMVDPQCTRPASARKGNWFCPDSTPDSAAAVRARAEKELGMVAAGAVTTAAASGWCNVTGCWNTLDTAHATFSGSGNYGYGSTPLGHVDLYFKTTSSGGKATVYPFWVSSSRGMKNVTLSAERLYLSTAYPGGNSMTPRVYAPKSVGNTTSEVSAAWPSPGPSLYENTTSWATIAAQANWWDYSSAYPGRWYFFGKSVKLQRQSNGAYYFRPANEVPKSPAGGGWSPT